MITIHFTPDDLNRTRFAYRPLLEILFSYRVLNNPAFQAGHQRWLDEASHALFDVELPWLAAVISPLANVIPHFLTPTPTTDHVNIEADFEDLLATPEAVIRKYMEAFILEDGESEIRRFFLTHPHEAVGCLIEDMRLYWWRTLAHHWSRMVSILEGDILYRGRIMALKGPGTLLADLHPRIAYRDSQIQIQPAHGSNLCDTDYALNGRGLHLVPSVISNQHRLQIVPEWLPRLSYPVRGAGRWHQKPISQSLELAMGTGRAKVLQALKTPATTGELAHSLGMTAGGISQHLDRLRRAGLVEPLRSGKRVYYQLTQRGEELLSLFERIL